jgi:hypothetical protein
MATWARCSQEQRDCWETRANWGSVETRGTWAPRTQATQGLRDWQGSRARRATTVPRSWVKQDSKETRDSKGTRDCQGPQGSEERLVTWAPRSLERQG